MPLIDRIRSAPLIHDPEMAERNARDLKAKSAQDEESGEWAALLESQSPAQRLLSGIFGTSPFLSRLILSNPAELWRALQSEPEDYLRQSAAELYGAIDECRRNDEAMKALRGAKRRLALVTALADLGGVWDVEQVTAALSEGADTLLTAAIRFLLREAAKTGKISPSPSRTSRKRRAAMWCSAWANMARAS